MGVDFRPLWPRMVGSPSHGSTSLTIPPAHGFENSHTYADLMADAGVATPTGCPDDRRTAPPPMLWPLRSALLHPDGAHP